MTAAQVGLALAVALAGSLSSCATGRDSAEIPDGEEYIEGALNGEQITLLITGNTGYGEEEAYNWRTYFAADGSLAGRRWSDSSRETDNGSWEITAESQLCHQWQGQWGNGERACFEVYKDGETVKLINMDGNADSYQMQVAAGNRLES